MTERDDQVSSAGGALLGALRKLHLTAGEPSSRAIASGIGGMSHTTVNAALKGPRVPSWPVLARLVNYLDGDIEEFRGLWIATRDAGEPTEPFPAPASKNWGDVSVFLSYARVDDSATYGRVLKVADAVANTYHSLTGRKVEIFKDTTSIALGEVWMERIQVGLASSSILLVFVTPAYLRSAMCRQELTEFLNFTRSSPSARIIIPLLYSDTERIEKHFGNDDMWQELSKRNRIDISHLRTSDAGSSKWIEAVERVAERIDEVLSSLKETEAPTGEVQLVQDVAPPASDEEEPGLLEKLAGIEGSADGTRADLVRLSELMNSLTAEVQKATPRMQRANSFAKRLGASNALAKAIEPIADEMALVANRIHSGIQSWSLVVDFAVNAIRGGEQDTSSSAHSFAATVEHMATTGITSLSSLEGMHAAIEKGKGYSGNLDRPLTKIQDAILQVAELRGLFSSWRSEIESLRAVNLIE